MKRPISCESGATDSCGLDRRPAAEEVSMVSFKCERRTCPGSLGSSPTQKRRLASRKQGSTAVGCGDELAGKVATCRIVLHDRPRRRAGWWSCKLIYSLVRAANTSCPRRTNWHLPPLKSRSSAEGGIHGSCPGGHGHATSTCPGSVEPTHSTERWRKKGHTAC